MAKFTKTYEDEKIISVLNFRGQDFTQIWEPYNNDGCRYLKDNSSIEKKIAEVFRDEDELDYILEYIEQINYDTNEDIEEALVQLNEFE